MKHINAVKKGFTMVELLVVLIIVAILAAVATPIFLSNTDRARASEAVATMSLIRQALRDHAVNGGDFYDIDADNNSADGELQNGKPTSVTAGVPTPATAGLNIDVGIPQYFSNRAFTVEATLAANEDGQSNLFDSPDAVDFIITARGVRSQQCTAAVGAVAARETNCAIKANDVSTIIVEMDNTGRTFVSYNNGTSWEAY